MLRIIFAVLISVLLFVAAASIVAAIGGYLFPAGEGMPLEEGAYGLGFIKELSATETIGFKLFHVVAIGVGAVAASASAFVVMRRARSAMWIGAAAPVILILFEAIYSLTPVWALVLEVMLIGFTAMSVRHLGHRAAV